MRMYHAALKNSERTRRHSISAYQTELILSECPENNEAGHSLLKGKTKVHRKRSSNSSISSLFFREEGRAVKTGAIVISSFITSYLPFYAYELFESFYCYFAHLENFVIILALSSSCTMPFIYVYRNETAKKEALKIVCWWRTDIPSTPTSLRSSFQHSFRNGHSPLPVRIVESDCGSMYSYTTECKECGAKQLISSLKPYRPISATVQELRNQGGSPGRGCGVSFKLGQFEKTPLSKCHICMRQDSGSSASSDDPLIGEKFRFPLRSSPASAKLMRHRLSNGSVNTRSDSLASTTSSVISYSGAQRCPRRYSTFSNDSTVAFPRRVADEMQETSPYHDVQKCHQGNMFKEFSLAGLEDPRQVFDINKYGEYPSPFRRQCLYGRECSLASNRYIWEIEECEVGEDDSIVVDRDQVKLNDFKIPYSREMEDIEKLKDIKRAKLFKKRFSQQDFNNHSRSTEKRFSCSGLPKVFRQLSRDSIQASKHIKEEENWTLKTKENSVHGYGENFEQVNDTESVFFHQNKEFTKNWIQSDL